MSAGKRLVRHSGYVYRHPSPCVYQRRDNPCLFRRHRSWRVPRFQSRVVGNGVCCCQCLWSAVGIHPWQCARGLCHCSLLDFWHECGYHLLLPHSRVHARPPVLSLRQRPHHQPFRPPSPVVRHGIGGVALRPYVAHSRGSVLRPCLCALTSVARLFD